MRLIDADELKELKPCPVCDGEAKVVAYYIKGTANRMNYLVGCKQNYCVRTKNYRKKENAIKAWNELEREQE